MYGCRKDINKTLPVKSAYNDGFEVIVIKSSNISTANSYKLSEAEQLVFNNPSNTFNIPISKIKEIQKAIETKNKQSKTSNYPFVRISLNDSGDIIDLSFHYSKSTFHYCYKISKNKIIPLWSSFSDLAKSTKTIYKQNPNKIGRAN